MKGLNNTQLLCLILRQLAARYFRLWPDPGDGAGILVVLSPILIPIFFGTDFSYIEYIVCGVEQCPERLASSSRRLDRDRFRASKGSIDDQMVARADIYLPIDHQRGGSLDRLSQGVPRGVLSRVVQLG